MTATPLGRALVLVVAASLGAGCWGDEVPSRDQVGAVRTTDGGVLVLFAPCADELVERVEVKRTDDDFAEIEGVLWSIESRSGEPAVDGFTVGDLPSGFDEVVPLDEPLEASDHVQLVVTSSQRGTIPMSFAVGDLGTDEVLVRSDRYRSRAEFDDEALDACE